MCDNKHAYSDSGQNGAISETLHQYETIVEAESGDLTQHSWYHGMISEEQAEATLSSMMNNQFFVRQTASNMILSKSVNGWKTHDIIHDSPSGYHLEGRAKYFKTIPEMIMYYQQFSISDISKQLLGTAVNRQPSTAGKCAS